MHNESWKAIAEETPPIRIRVLALVEVTNSCSKQKSLFPVIAEWISPKTVKSEDFLNEDYGWGIKEELEDYEEETDTYWVKENWFESPLEGDIMWVINDPIKYWKPFTNFPKEEE